MDRKSPSLSVMSAPGSWAHCWQKETKQKMMIQLLLLKPTVLTQTPINKIKLDGMRLKEMRFYLHRRIKRGRTSQTRPSPRSRVEFLVDMHVCVYASKCAI